MKELERRLNNIVQVGTVVEIDKSKALARVNILGRVTDFLPVKMIGNSFVKVFIPIRVNEQVLVVCPFGNANSGFIIPGIFNKGCEEPSGSNPDKAIIEFSGGVRIDSDGVNLNLFTPGILNIAATGGINIASAGDINIRGSKIFLN